jgi:hypothetical protein
MQRVIAPILLVLLIVGVVIAIVYSVRQAGEQRASQHVGVVRGLIGSEKQSYLTDPKVLDIFRRNGIDLQVETAGSREISSRPDLANYDFGFPAGVPAARKLMQTMKVSKSYTPFFTPMTVASWKQIAGILIVNGMVRKKGEYYYIIDMKRLLQAIAQSKRWNELKDASAYPVSKSILVTSTDVRKSNSAAMYLALASYIFNNGEIVQNDQQIAKVLPEAAPLFLRQGFQESSSAGPFEDYTTMGMGKAPLVMIYEAQFIEFAIEHPNARNNDMVLLYPEPTVFTKHTLVPFNAKGDKVGDLLQNDPDLQRLAVEHGLRTADTAYQKEFWGKNGVHVPETLLDVVDPPSFEVLEAMIKNIEQQLNSQ